MLKTKLPVMLCSLVGAAMVVQFFVPHPASAAFLAEMSRWAKIVTASALLLGILSLLRLHGRKILKREKGFAYSIVTAAAFVAMIAAGFAGGMQQGSAFHALFVNVLIPLEATMFALLAFYMASAAFRAFRLRSAEAALLILSAVILMLARVPLGEAAGGFVPWLGEFILDFPNTAAKRAILIGVGFGIVSTCLKIIAGMEKSYLGKGD